MGQHCSMVKSIPRVNESFRSSLGSCLTESIHLAHVSENEIG